MSLFPSRRTLFVFAVLFLGRLSGYAQDLAGVLDRARAAQSSGNYTEAAADYARATAMDPTIPELWANRGVMEFLANQPDSSIQSNRHALQLNPKLFTPLLFLGKAYIQINKPGQALLYLDRAHLQHPLDVEVLLSQGKANQALQNARKAAAAYAEAARLAADNPAAWFGLGVSSLAVIESDGRNLAALQPPSIWAKALYADDLLAQSRPVEALETYKTASASATPAQTTTLASTVAQMQVHPEIFPLPAGSRDSLPKLKAQLTETTSKVSQPPCPPPASVLLREAACAFWTGDYSRTATLAGITLLQSPKSPEALYWSIKANERLAVQALSRFEELAPHSPATFVMVGDLYRHQQQPDSALAEYNKALAIDPHDAPAQLGAAVAQLSLNNPDEAANIAQSALADSPDDAALNLIFAETLVARQKFSKAEPYLQKSVAGPPELQPRAHALLGRVYADQDKTGQAIEQFQLALPSDDDGSLHYQLARLYRKAGNIPEAQKAEAASKALSQKRLANAAIAIREATNPSSDPKP